MVRGRGLTWGDSQSSNKQSQTKRSEQTRLLAKGGRDHIKSRRAPVLEGEVPFYGFFAVWMRFGIILLFRLCFSVCKRGCWETWEKRIYFSFSFLLGITSATWVHLYCSWCPSFVTWIPWLSLGWVFAFQVSILVLVLRETGSCSS